MKSIAAKSQKLTILELITLPSFLHQMQNANESNESIRDRMHTTRQGSGLALFELAGQPKVTDLDEVPFNGPLPETRARGWRLTRLTTQKWPCGRTVGNKLKHIKQIASLEPN